MNTISAGEMIRFGWETFKKRPWFFIGLVVLIALMSGVLGALAPDPVQNIFDIVLAIAVIVLNIFIEMGLVAFALKVHDDPAAAAMRDLWHPQSFWKYVAAKILTGIITGAPMLAVVSMFAFAGSVPWIVIVAFTLLIPATVWAVIAALALLFATYCVVDRGQGPIVAMKESIRMTKGHRWQLFILSLALILINILGAIALLVGLLVTIPVSLLAIAHTYRTLSRASAPVSA